MPQCTLDLFYYVYGSLYRAMFPMISTSLSIGISLPLLAYGGSQRLPIHASPALRPYVRTQGGLQARGEQLMGCMHRLTSR